MGNRYFGWDDPLYGWVNENEWWFDKCSAPTKREIEWYWGIDHPQATGEVKITPVERKYPRNPLISGRRL